MRRNEPKSLTPLASDTIQMRHHSSHANGGMMRVLWAWHHHAGLTDNIFSQDGDFVVHCVIGRAPHNREKTASVCANLEAHRLFLGANTFLCTNSKPKQYGAAHCFSERRFSGTPTRFGQSAFRIFLVKSTTQANKPLAPEASLCSATPTSGRESSRRPQPRECESFLPSGSVMGMPN